MNKLSMGKYGLAFEINFSFPKIYLLGKAKRLLQKRKSPTPTAVPDT